MDDNDLDSHICLQCQKHIIGLQKYVQHKKYECPASNKHEQITHPRNVDISLNSEQDSISEEKNSFSTSVDQNDETTRTSPDGHSNKQLPEEEQKVGSGIVKRRVGRPRKKLQVTDKKPNHDAEEQSSDGRATSKDQQSDFKQAALESSDSETANTSLGEKINQPHKIDENSVQKQTPGQTVRRRGRPRKYKPQSPAKTEQSRDNSENAINKQVETANPGKRRVGRPRKIKTDEGAVTEGSHTVTDSPVNAKRSGDVSSKQAKSDVVASGHISQRRRQEHYDCSDLYKPRLSFGGSRRQATDDTNHSDVDKRSKRSRSPVQTIRSMTSPRRLSDCSETIKRYKHSARSKKLLRLMAAAVLEAELDDEDEDVQSEMSKSAASDPLQSRTHVGAIPPEPEIMSYLCGLKLQCHSDSKSGQVSASCPEIKVQIPVPLRMINLLHELSFESDYEGLDYIPEVNICDNTERIIGEDATDDTTVTLEESTDYDKETKKITISGQTYTMLLKCQSCDKRFINALAYHSHLKSHLCQNSDKTSKDDEKTSLDQTEMVNTSITESQQQQSEVKVVTDNESSKNIGKERSDSFSETCPGCLEEFTNKYLCARHFLHALCLESTTDPYLQRLALPLKPYQCELCSFYCDTLASFLKHIGTLKHSDIVDQVEGDMICSQCDYRTNSKKNIYLHFQSDHKQSDLPSVLKEEHKTYICHFCDKNFSSSRALRTHTATEPGHRRLGKGGTWCDICKKNFSTSSNLQQHVKRIHDSSKDYTCDVCNKSFSYKNNLDMHYRSQMHRDNMLAKCHTHQDPDKAKNSEDTNDQSTASKVNSTVDMPNDLQIKQEPGLLDSCPSSTNNVKEPFTVKHRGRGRPRKESSLRTSDDQIYKCELCGYKLFSAKQLEKHEQSRYHIRMEEEANKSSECFICSICEHKFYSKERFALHKLVHKDKPKLVGRGAKGINRLRGIPERFHKLALSLPKKAKSEVQCPECEGWFKANTIIPHIRCKHGDGADLPYKCNFCPLAFPSNSSLYRHHKRHVGLLSFKCEICSKGFRSKSDLESHELTFHKDELHIEARLQCHLCGAGFMQQSKLNTHMKEKHEKVRKHWCSWPGCHRAFLHQQEFVIHMRGHTGEKPYLCDYCGFATKSKVQLARHERIHMNVANYHCKYCPYTSRMSAGLRRHMRLHTGAKPYRCPHCEHRCYSHTNLRLHINNSRLHPGQKLYNCHYCQFATNATTDFLNHMFEVHNQRPEAIGNVAEYCGVYLPEEDITEVKEGCEPIQLPKRKPRCKVSSHVKLAEEHEMMNDQVQVEQSVDMKLDSEMNNVCMMESDESLLDQGAVHEELQENEMMSYQQLSVAGAQVVSDKSENQQYKVLSIMETPDGNIVVVNEHMGEHLISSEQEDQDMAEDNQTVETFYIPKVEKEEVIQSDDNHEGSIVIQSNPSQHEDVYEASKPMNMVYIQDGGQIIVTQSANEQIIVDSKPETAVSDSKDSSSVKLEDEVINEPVKEVYLASEGIQLTDLVQGLEDTGAVVELRMEDDYSIPEGKPGQVVQVMGDDNKPIHFYYV